MPPETRASRLADGSPGADEEPAFAAPWEAEAFALRAHLVATGRLDATRFANVFAAALAEAPEARDDGTGYFVAFVTALERAVGDLTHGGELAAEQAAWREAAAATPHGEPIVLPPGRGAPQP